MKIRVACLFEVAALLALTVSSGCAAHERGQAYERVAKEWSKAIRASQVIPVYPLTEDIQPGDMFIVDVPVETEQELWDEKGYLPLGYHFGRLKLGAKAYADFYGHGYGTSDAGSAPPMLFQEAPATPSGAPVRVTATPESNEIPDEFRREPQNWGIAPHVSFPTYSVDVSRAGGFNVGLPVQGVPIALGMLGSNRATASVSLKEAYSYGIDAESVYAAMRELYSKPPTGPGASTQPSAMRSALESSLPHRVRSLGSDVEHVRYRFLRVVTRVYLVGAVDVSLTDHSDWASDLGFGKTGFKNNFSVIAQLGKDASQYEKLLGALNAGLVGQASAPTTKQTDAQATTTPAPAASAPAAGDASTPERTNSTATSLPAGATTTTRATTTTVAAGATVATPTPPKTPASQPATLDLGARVKVVSVSDRSIALREKFTKPLVIGYVAFDLPIGVGGQLGSRRVDTFKRINASTLRSGLRDNAQLIESWLHFHESADKLLDDWGKSNARWLSREGFSMFSSGDHLTDYKADSLHSHFRRGPVYRFFFHLNPYHKRPWSALYNRIVEDLVMMPDGLVEPSPDDGGRPSTQPQINKIIQQLAK